MANRFPLQKDKISTHKHTFWIDRDSSRSRCSFLNPLFSFTWWTPVLWFWETSALVYCGVNSLQRPHTQTCRGVSYCKQERSGILGVICFFSASLLRFPSFPQACGSTTLSETFTDRIHTQTVSKGNLYCSFPPPLPVCVQRYLSVCLADLSGG